jgi:hypothetical protein
MALLSSSSAFTFQQVLDITLVRKLHLDLVSHFLSCKSLKYYVFGGLVRDQFTLDLITGKNLESDEKLKSFLSNKFSKSSKFDVDIVVNIDIQLLDKLCDELLVLLKTSLRYATIKTKSNTDVLVTKSNFYGYGVEGCKTIEFTFDDIKYGIDLVVMYAHKNWDFDFNANCLCYIPDEFGSLNLDFVPGYIKSNQTRILMQKTSEITQDILSGKIKLMDSLHKKLTNYTLSRVKKNVKGKTSTVIRFNGDTYDFICAYKRIVKFENYGYHIYSDNDTEYPSRVVNKVKCCKNPETITLPKHCTKSKLYGLCINCHRLTISNCGYEISRNNYTDVKFV